MKHYTHICILVEEMKASGGGNDVSEVTQLAESRPGLDSNIPMPTVPCVRLQLLFGAPACAGPGLQSGGNNQADDI